MHSTNKKEIILSAYNMITVDEIDLYFDADIANIVNLIMFHVDVSYLACRGP